MIGRLGHAEVTHLANCSLSTEEAGRRSLNVLTKRLETKAVHQCEGGRHPSTASEAFTRIKVSERLTSGK